MFSKLHIVSYKHIVWDEHGHRHGQTHTQKLSEQVEQVSW